MLLVMDIGNTHTVIGLFDKDVLKLNWRVHTDPALTEDEFSVIIGNLFSAKNIPLSAIEKTVISCVVPPLMKTMDGFCRKYLDRKPCWVDAGVVDMPILYANPAEVGADRLVNAVAAYAKYRTSLIVIDFGTATTFDAISHAGEYMGGAISPGVGIAANALFEHTAKLPRVELLNPPETVIGKDTAASMKSGIIYGYAELVDGMVRRMKQEMPPPRPKVIATGGLALFMKGVAGCIEAVEPGLTLEGLRILSARF